VQPSPLAGAVEMKDLSYASQASVLVYGPSGIGKTELVFNFPTTKKRFVADCEAGLRVVAHKPATVKPILTYQDIQATLQYLEADEEHDVVIIDSLTEMARVVMLGAMALPAAGGGRPMAEIPVLQDWSLTIERMRTTIRRFRLLIKKGKWVFFTAAEGIEKDQVTGRVMGGPELPGKQLPPEVCYLMDEVYRMTAVSSPAGLKRVISTAPDGIWIAKTRVPKLPSLVEVVKDSSTTLDFLRRK
jgi:hypothetical protein